CCPCSRGVLACSTPLSSARPCPRPSKPHPFSSLILPIQVNSIRRKINNARAGPAALPAPGPLPLAVPRSPADASGNPSPRRPLPRRRRRAPHTRLARRPAAHCNRCTTRLAPTHAQRPPHHRPLRALDRASRRPDDAPRARACTLQARTAGAVWDWA
ncbi:hypothetical protein DFH06DRAFT_109011, partial [Mycena polygramma]